MAYSRLPGGQSLGSLTLSHPHVCSYTFANEDYQQVYVLRPSSMLPSLSPLRSQMAAISYESSWDTAEAL